VFLRLKKEDVQVNVLNNGKKRDLFKFLSIPQSVFIIIGIILLIINIPNITFLMLSLASQSEDISMETLRTFNYLRFTSIFMSIIVSILNPLVYALRYKECQIQCIKIFCLWNIKMKRKVEIIDIQHRMAKENIPIQRSALKY